MHDTCIEDIKELHNLIHQYPRGQLSWHVVNFKNKWLAYIAQSFHILSIVVTLRYSREKYHVKWRILWINEYYLKYRFKQIKWIGQRLYNRYNGIN